MLGGNELTGRVREGDRQAAEDLYVRWRQPVFDLLARRLGNLEEAENLTQDALLRALHASRTREVKRFGAYVMRVAHNLATDALRRRRFRGEVPDMEAALEVMPDLDAAEHVRLRRAVRQLPPDQRQVVLLRYDQELSFGEIAATLGMSATNPTVSIACATRTAMTNTTPSNFCGPCKEAASTGRMR